MTRDRLLSDLETALRAPHPEASQVAKCVRAILEFLCSKGLASDDDFVMIAQFVLLKLLEDARTSQVIELLPDGLKDVIDDMGTFLDDVPTSPAIAQSFQSTPEQLLARLNQLSLR